MPISKLTSNENNLLEDFQSLKDSKQDNRIIIDGLKAVKKLFSSNSIVKKVLADPTQLPYLNQFKDSATEIFILDKSYFKSIIGSHYHQNIIAIADKPNFKNIDDLYGAAIALNALTSPENVGSILRTASAFNINNIIFDHRTVSPFMRRSIRVSMGNVFSLNLYQVDSLIDNFEKLKSKNYKIISTANVKSSIEISKTPLDNNSIIIIGNEGHGIDEEIINSSDYISKIKIDDETAHLNASVAASIFMYELSNRINFC